jgi:CRP/FNR family transcriptional regulator
LNHLAEYLSKTEILGLLTEPDRHELSKIALRRSLNKGDLLCSQGETWPYVIYIASGMLRSVINAPDGRSYVVGTWEKGEVFWAHSIFDQDPSPSTLEATRRTDVYQWEGEKVLQVVLRNQEAIRALLRRQTQLIRKRREVIYNLAFNPVASRLAKLIVEQVFTSDVPTVQRELTLEDMAQMVGSSPEVVCRLLYQFQADGAIAINRFSITLCDRQQLERLVIHD